jgi:hypothetical protein
MRQSCQPCGCSGPAAMSGRRAMNRSRSRTTARSLPRNQDTQDTQPMIAPLLLLTTAPGEGALTGSTAGLRVGAFGTQSGARHFVSKPDRTRSSIAAALQLPSEDPAECRFSVYGPRAAPLPGLTSAANSGMQACPRANGGAPIDPACASERLAVNCRVARRAGIPGRCRECSRATRASQRAR